MKKLLKVVIPMLLVSSTLASCGESTISGEHTSEQGSKDIDVSMLFTGWVNSPTDSNDIYRKYIKDHYGINIQAIATNDFSSDVVIKFASNNKPDIVVFDTIETYRTINEQGVLIDDWTKYLDLMPNLKKSMLGDGSEKGVAEKMFTTQDGKLQALWTTPNPPTWSLKLREEWVNEFRNSDPSLESWNPEKPEDLLDFARWIKVNKPGCYGFTSAGSRASFGTLGNYISYMFGYVNELPWGLYLDENDEVSFGVIDGAYEKYLNYIKTIVNEGLIDPQWYEQDWEHKTKTKEGKIGIEWYPGSISQETEDFQKDKLEPGKTTLDWWKTYNLPSDGGKYSGFMPIDSYFGKIITVSKKASLSKDKMDGICRLLNDIYFEREKDDKGNITYKRGVAYDALRWGVGIEHDLQYQPIANTAYNYICTSSGDDSYYRETPAGQGAWDWGAWFSNTGDGVIQGTTKTINDIILKVYEHNQKTSEMPTQVPIGSSLNLDPSLIKNIQTRMENYSYKYVTGQNTGFASYADFKNAWLNSWGGNKILEEAKKQFKELGFSK